MVPSHTCFVVSVCSLIVFSLHGCGTVVTTTTPPTTTPTTTPTPTPTPTPGIICPVPAPSDGPVIDVPSEDVVPLTWDAARDLAREKLESMDDCDKFNMMQGEWYGAYPNYTNPTAYSYVGNIRGLPDLEIPSLNFQDAAGGFRPTVNELVGTATVWPSLLALAATWDPSVVRDFAVALGDEFAGKGANSILGPSVNVHRVARNGRNFEYLSGEDPYLGSKLVDQYVRGVQSRGVMAVVKHYVLNLQETNRQTVSLDADDRTKWELYYPPFKAAIDAGVSAVMCSYNLENGTHSCANSHELENFKTKMDFQGFVQSDWWATHSTSVEEGLDMNMPGDLMETWFMPSNLAKVSSLAIDESVTRILSAMYRLDLPSRTRCAPPLCNDIFLTNVSTAAHKNLAQSAAAESIVLLKNDDSVLPIGPPGDGRPSSILIVGSPSVAQAFNPNTQTPWNVGDYYSGGGSGHCVVLDPTTPLTAIVSRAQQEGIEVHVSSTDDVHSATVLAAQADLTLVFAGATSGEDQDRANLTLDHNADDLIRGVASTSTKTVVLMMIPGAVTMPWRADVEGIAALFLGGERTAAAWVEVVFGDRAPAGRLPIMMPVSESDTFAPSDDLQVTLSEGVKTSYRNPNFRAAFPFGFGLTYTTFFFGEPTIITCLNPSMQRFCIQMAVRNVGNVAAKAVPQLYLSMAESSISSPVLKGFIKTDLIAPGSSTSVLFTLLSHDLSYWNDGWHISASDTTAHIGTSYGNYAHTVRLMPPLPAVELVV